MQGVVEEGDACRCDYDRPEGAVLINGQDVLDRIRSVFHGDKKVIVGVMDELFSGDLFIENGWGYSEYTPMDPDVMKVGDHDLIDILLRHEGKKVTLVVSDEPVDLFGLTEELEGE
jgi:hypothetical protein